MMRNYVIKQYGRVSLGKCVLKSLEQWRVRVIYLGLVKLLKKVRGYDNMD